MPRKYRYPDVKLYIETQSHCKLLSKEYKSTKDKLLLLCPCGKTFEVTYEHFRLNNQRQCRLCSDKPRYTIEDIKRIVSENSDCKLLSKQYINNESNLDLQCRCGNPFQTSFKRFMRLNKRQCDDCTNRGKSKMFCKTTDEFKDEVYQVHGQEYSVIGEYKGRDKKVLIKHHKCGFEWETRAGDFILNKSGCPQCKESKGEKKIRRWLTKHHFPFTQQHKFDDCKNKRPLPFDFAIFNNNNLVCLIEYDGKQHYLNESMYYCDYVLENDEIKNHYCKEKKIKLLRIPYTELKNIELILKDALL